MSGDNIPYSNREIDGMFREIMSLLNEIKDQTTKTNGRVSKLEIWKEGVMAKFTGVVATISILWVIIKDFIINK